MRRSEAVDYCVLRSSVPYPVCPIEFCGLRLYPTNYPRRGPPLSMLQFSDASNGGVCCTIGTGFVLSLSVCIELPQYRTSGPPVYLLAVYLLDLSRSRSSLHSRRCRIECLAYRALC
ncbi:hypothetical protein VPH35_034901 [Triticum aestivum]